MKLAKADTEMPQVCHFYVRHQGYLLCTVQITRSQDKRQFVQRLLLQSGQLDLPFQSGQLDLPLRQQVQLKVMAEDDVVYKQSK